MLLLQIIWIKEGPDQHVLAFDTHVDPLLDIGTSF
jgi:hypothetical protein